MQIQEAVEQELIGGFRAIVFVYCVIMAIMVPVFFLSGSRS